MLGRIADRLADFPGPNFAMGQRLARPRLWLAALQHKALVRRLAVLSVERIAVLE